MNTSFLESEKTGFIKGKYGRTHVRIFGAEKNNTPIICLHGGPGSTHFMMLPIKKMAKNRPVIFYDQLGCGLSDRPKNNKIWSIKTYVDELENVRRTLKINSFIILASSWGPMLGFDYYLKYRRHVKAMILASPCLSARQWMKDANLLISKLPKRFQVSIRKYEKMKKYDHPNYLKACDEYYSRHVRRYAKGDSIERRLSRATAGTQAYLKMWGPTEFCATGSLRNYEREKYLPSISCPTLYLCGKYDEARPETVKSYSVQTPQSEFHVFNRSSHMPYFEEPNEFIRVVQNFLVKFQL